MQKNKKFFAIFYLTLFFLPIYAQVSPYGDSYIPLVREETPLFQKAIYNGSLIKEVSQEELKSRLEYLNKSTPLDLNYNSTVHGYVDRYLRMGQSYGKIIGLSEFYFPLFEEILNKYNIPKELKYLAVVESNLNARAGSKMGAKGLWQFMPITGKAFGLSIDSYVDERYDPIKSTEAAAKYLSYLYKNLGDWNLALAAYNCGMGNINKAIRGAGGKKDYWAIRNYLPAETRGYIPSFISANYVMTYHQKHNFAIEKLKYKYQDTDTIHVKNKVNFTSLSSILSIPIKDIQFLNPQYNLGIIPKQAGKSFYIRLPKNKIENFKENETKIYSGKIVSTSSSGGKVEINKNYDPSYYYQVKSGDNLTKIAAKYHTSVKELQRLNGLPANLIKIGQIIKYREEKPLIYLVKSGETLQQIAEKYNLLSIEEIKKENNLTSSIVLPGTLLKIPKK